MPTPKQYRAPEGTYQIRKAQTCRSGFHKARWEVKPKVWLYYCVPDGQTWPN